MVHAQPVRQGGVDIQSVTGELLQRESESEPHAVCQGEGGSGGGGERERGRQRSGVWSKAVIIEIEK